jgi:hypothetical protein
MASSSDPIDNIEHQQCETNKDCDKKMECVLSQCLDPCRKSPCGTNAVCKVFGNTCVPVCV